MNRVFFLFCWFVDNILSDDRMLSEKRMGSLHKIEWCSITVMYHTETMLGNFKCTHSVFVVREALP